MIPTQFDIDFYMSYIPEHLSKMVRFDEPAKHDASYKDDCAWFAANPERRLLVRREAIGEYHFDYRLLRTGQNGKRDTGASANTCEDGTLYHPLTLVLVTQLTLGTHSRVPFWIGSALSPDYEPEQYRTDQEVASLLIECEHRGHGDEEAVNRWLKRFCRSVQDDPVFQKRRLMRVKVDGLVN